MESWSYVSQGNKGFIFDETVSPPDFLAKRKNEFMGWGLNSPFSYGSELLVPSEQINESQGFEELGFQGLMPKQFQEDPIRDLTTPNAFSGEDDSCSKLSNSVVESSGRVSSLIDLKLGSSSSFKSPPILCSAESISPAKRARGASFNSQTPFCQVHGCDKDLSSSKDYHKRHRVCKDHSKTPKVIVNGIEQRFCQQCSRFHLLAEFDDGKRSCRKRLACHNERRRKPQVGISSRSGRLLQSYDGNRFHGVPTSFICQDILPAALLHPEKFEPNNWCGRIGNGPQSAITTSNAYLHPKPLFPSFDFEKQNPFFHDHDINTATGSYPKSVPRSLFQNTSFGSEDFTVFDTTSSFQVLPGMPDSSCALSLLSSQPENTSSHSSGIPLANPIIGSHAHYNVSQVSDRLVGASRASNSFPSSGMSSAEGANSEVADGIFHGLDFLNEKDRYSRQGGATIDLLQLSSQLHRVEHQRHSMQVKRENDASCCL